MFLSTTKVLKLKIKEFIGRLAVCTFLIGFFIFLFILDGNEELRTGVLNDIIAFGVTALAVYVFYRFAIATNLFGTQKKSKYARHSTKR